MSQSQTNTPSNLPFPPCLHTLFTSPSIVVLPQLPKLPHCLLLIKRRSHLDTPTPKTSKPSLMAGQPLCFIQVTGVMANEHICFHHARSVGWLVYNVCCLYSFYMHICKKEKKRGYLLKNCNHKNVTSPKKHSSRNFSSELSTQFVKASFA